MKKIKEASEVVGVSKRTLQFYSDSGLLDMQRSPQNYRLYSDDDIECIWWILLCRSLGMSIGDVREAGVLTPVTMPEVLTQHLEKMEHQKEDMEQQIRFASRLRKFGMPPMGAVEGEELTLAEEIMVLKRCLSQSHPSCDGTSTGEICTLSEAFKEWLSNLDEQTAKVIRAELQKELEKKRRG